MINLYDFNLDDCLDDELISIISENEYVRIERIISMGQFTPKEYIYDQVEDEFVTVIKGEASIYFNDEKNEVKLLEGDSLMIEAGRRHQVTYTSAPCIWLCVFYKKGDKNE